MSEPQIVRGSWPHGVVEMGDGTIFVKVISFPVTDGSGYAGESMWVILTEGDEFNGVGTLNNQPNLSSIEQYSYIRFAGGTETTKPHFVEVVAPPTLGEGHE